MSDYKIIPITLGYEAIVDADDYEIISKIKWRAVAKKATHVYAETGTRGKLILMHRLIMCVSKNKQIDHINHDTLDNRKCNLRICSHIENCRNRKKRIGVSSVYKGVQWVKRDKKWIAGIKLNKKQIYLGKFDSEIDAATAYNMAALRHFREFAKLNLIPMVAA